MSSDVAQLEQVAGTIGFVIWSTDFLALIFSLNSRTTGMGSGPVSFGDGTVASGFGHEITGFSSWLWRKDHWL